MFLEPSCVHAGKYSTYIEVSKISHDTLEITICRIIAILFT